MKSRTIAALLSAALLSLILTGCQSDAQTPESTTTPEVSAAPTPEPAPVFLARLDSTLYRSAPEFSEETVLGALPKGTPVTALDAQQVLSKSVWQMDRKSGSMVGISGRKT